ncbi:MAG: hypothetical protein WD512_16305 [Candidatus Paceibacterota bacterium]
MEKFYNSPVCAYTLLISEIPEHVLKNISGDFATQILKTSTLPGIITTKMLENGMLLSTNNDYEKLKVSVYQPSTTKICTCNNYHIECKLKNCNIANTVTCTDLNNRMIEINGISLIRGNILVNGGIVHILEKFLCPTF